MNNDTYEYNNIDKTGKPTQKWYLPTAWYKIILRVPAAVAKKRIQAALASVVTAPGDLKSKVAYTGSLDGNRISALFFFPAMNGAKEYYLRGEIIEDLNGCRIEMSIQNKMNLWSFIKQVSIGALFFSLMAICKPSKTAKFKIPEPTVAVLISFLQAFFMTSLFLVLFFGGILFIYGKLNCNNAASDIGGVLNKWIYDEVPPVTSIAREAEFKIKFKTAAKMFRHPFSFKGRIRRMEYGLVLIIHAVFLQLVDIVVNILDRFINLRTVNSTSILVFIILVIIVILVIWNYIAQALKRCHDCGKSGWWLLIPVHFIILLFEKGQPGPNQYGPDPKEAEALHKDL